MSGWKKYMYDVKFFVQHILHSLVFCVSNFIF